jgi:AbrB family looped-hinge helix DNA binding protein
LEAHYTSRVATTTVSAKFQVVIPEEIRDRHGLKAGHAL